MGGPDSLWGYHEIMENTFRMSNKQKISWYYIDNIIGTFQKKVKHQNGVQVFVSDQQF